MSYQFLKKILTPYLKLNLVVLFVFAAALCYFNLVAGIIALIIAAALLYYTRNVSYSKQEILRKYVEDITDEMDTAIQQSVINHPLPLCMLNNGYEVLWYNKKFHEIFEGLDNSQLELSDVLLATQHDFFSDEINDKVILVNLGPKTYRLLVAQVQEEEFSSIMLYWLDTTSQENLKILHRDEKNCMAYIYVDNYEELIASTPDERRSLLDAQIEQYIRQWCAKVSGSITKYARNRYFLVFEYKYLEKLEGSKFTILDEVREIESEADFPVSLSIGIGVGGKTPAQQDEYAAAALDLALGRGGDQAVVKKINKIEYFGGRMQTVEKRNKGKSRIMAHAIRQLVDQSSKVIIMGHRNPDMDSFGSALGIYRIAKNKNKDAYIVVNSPTEAISSIYKEASDSGNYRFINSEAAKTMVDPATLIVVVDVHTQRFVECPEILRKTDKLVVIDHHRKLEDFIDYATLTYMETYASSTSELVAEILQYVGDKKDIDKIEAEALLAGITVDTKNFSVKTGVRTFEAASWLRRAGADTSNVRKLFQTDMQSFKIKSEIISHAEIFGNGIAISGSEKKSPNIQVIIAQAADELLNIKGVKASFVFGQDEQGGTLISGRSLGGVNVQTIMERMGGGGHLNSAGAQVKEPIDDAVIRLKEVINELDA